MSDTEMETLETLGGNTKTPKVKRPNQLMNWCFTWNNYPEGSVERLETIFKDLCSSYAFQEEIGEKEGTPHLQGVICLKKAGRFTEFTLSKAIHWEGCKCVPAAFKYATKEDTRKPGTRPYVLNYKVPTPLKLITPDKWWQKEILATLKQTPDDRTVHWYWSSKGGVGKSSFTKYCVIKEQCLFFEEGKKADIMNLIFNAPDDRLERIMIDVPRDNGNNVSYKSIEAIKNGLIYSPKYEGGYKYFNSPHIFVFANLPPDECRLSADRWHIVCIDNPDIE